mgnify:CR=1 FL=1
MFNGKFLTRLDIASVSVFENLSNNNALLFGLPNYPFPLIMSSLINIWGFVSNKAAVCLGLNVLPRNFSPADGDLGGVYPFGEYYLNIWIIIYQCIILMFEFCL